ncbi:MAG TPA: NAD(P)-binding domain-containing protein [Trebonia sp.]|jgi:cation diffusion facilitator CzcD-associated flavoprotein CzcO|nr:NAD(P)-binding domain-containing protein [Trebonia sp.]
MLVVIGGGPYGIATAARAIEAGIETAVVGRPLSFWTGNMPAGMYLRSGPDWHLDASHVHTFEAFLSERGIAARDVDPVPIAVFLDYARWFQRQKHVTVRENLVTAVRGNDDGTFQVDLDDGVTLAAESVVAAPGVRYFQHRPEWSAPLPAPLCSHTCELVRFDDFAGARVLIVGGRQSAYEWAALIGEHGAARIDIVHRHDVPRFDRVSWKFVDPYLERTLATRAWWRTLSPGEQDAIGRKFWEVGRLTIEWWLTPRLRGDRFRVHPGTSVVSVAAPGAGGIAGSAGARVRLSDGDELGVDRIVLATGYKADLARVPYLAGVLERVDTADGFPVLDATFQTSLPGLYLPGFTGTRDFGPFFGFTKGCPAAAELVTRGLLRK